MGVVLTTLRRISSGTSGREMAALPGLERERSAVEEKIGKKLKARARNDPGTVRSLNGLLLKLSTLADGFEKCRTEFIAADSSKTNSISFEELKAAARKLGYKSSEENLDLIFQHADIDDKKQLTFREFLITILYLTLIEDSHPDISIEVQNAIDLAIDAFLYFDKTGTGFLNKSEVMEASRDNKEGLPESMVRRFDEMNADGSGSVTLAEFVHALELWAGVENNSNNAEQEGELGMQLRTASFNSRKLSVSSAPRAEDEDDADVEAYLKRTPSAKFADELVQNRVSEEADAVAKRVEMALRDRAKSSVNAIRAPDALLLKFSLIRNGFNKVRKVFAEIDTDGNGNVDFDELKNGMSKLGYDVDESELKGIFEYSDIKNEGALNFREFLIPLLYLALLEPKSDTAVDSKVYTAFNVVLDAFQYFDTSGEGLLDQQELVSGFSSTDGTSVNLICQRFKEMDCDNSGYVSLNEFLYAIEDWAGFLDEDEQ
mmetsp:Transcript_7289/g.22205  ORF Transcript_7289/g.22205 Transcript_7289/m.22205 type:complete len:488 (+) Transcript_7289:102-1565(+)|eukprot:CAMPEP_0198735022 /NCGR_PEP_ID=MMETSP1475-20131203/56773_1 /TAXON_ID= ORGANISM="Unidentified sp., Strain CCMP1999" /NCGR_SAMPLE_ID=MMETSP1475 /ASSEMBLY_ACC=CAM_ASM_001111 /LENGTH=487 /DNA_ID=CAMNT_0044498613 /DNA_START=31 /DNA_END=1494 /DNA_ORIENTATION=-